MIGYSRVSPLSRSTMSTALLGSATHAARRVSAFAARSDVVDVDPRVGLVARSSPGGQQFEGVGRGGTRFGGVGAHREASVVGQVQIVVAEGELANGGVIESLGPRVRSDV